MSCHRKSEIVFVLEPDLCGAHRTVCQLTALDLLLVGHGLTQHPLLVPALGHQPHHRHLLAHLVISEMWTNQRSESSVKTNQRAALLSLTWALFCRS